MAESRPGPKPTILMIHVRIPTITGWGLRLGSRHDTSRGAVNPSLPTVRAQRKLGKGHGRNGISGYPHHCALNLGKKNSPPFVDFSHLFSDSTFGSENVQSSGCLTLTELCSGCVHSQRVPNQAYAPLLQGWAAAFAAATLAAAARQSATA